MCRFRAATRSPSSLLADFRSRSRWRSDARFQFGAEFFARLLLDVQTNFLLRQPLAEAIDLGLQSRNLLTGFLTDYR